MDYRDREIDIDYENFSIPRGGKPRIIINEKLLRAQAVISEHQGNDIINLLDTIEQLRDDLFNTERACDRLRDDLNTSENKNKKAEKIIEAYKEEYGDYLYEEARWSDQKDEIILEYSLEYDLGKKVLKDLEIGKKKIVHLSRLETGTVKIDKNYIKK